MGNGEFSARLFGAYVLHCCLPLLQDYWVAKKKLSPNVTTFFSLSLGSLKGFRPGWCRNPTKPSLAESSLFLLCHPQRWVSLLEPSMVLLGLFLETTKVIACGSTPLKQPVCKRTEENCRMIRGALFETNCSSLNCP